MKNRNFNTAKRNSKRFLSVMLSIIIVLSLVPMSIFRASAAEPVTLGAPLNNNDYSQIRAMKNGWIAGSVEFQNPVDLKINNVYSGTKIGAFDPALVTDDPNSPAPIYFNYLVEQYNNPTISQAVVYVDPDTTPNLLNSGVQIELSIPGTTAISSYARWGVEITGSVPVFSSALITEAYNNATITTQKGKSISYFLSDANGTQLNSGSPVGTLDGDWQITKYASYGPYYYYLNGAVPEAGDRATIRVYGACGTWAMNNYGNYQWMSVYIDLTVISVSKTALKNAIGAHVKTEGASAQAVSAYNTALANAVAVYNKPNAEQSEVDQATNALNAAINALGGRHVNVTFDGQSATTLETTSLLVKPNSPMPSITPPTRLGYTFDGFYTAPNGGGTKYYNADGTSARNMDLTQDDVTLYAGWTANSYTVRFDSDGGNQIYNKSYNIQSTSTLATPIRKGSTFTGWKVISSDGNWTVGSTVPAGTSLNGKYGNVNLKAQWSAIDYTTKATATEYYYPAGTQFVEYIGLVRASNIFTSLSDKLRDYGYPHVLGKDLNDNADGDYVRMGYSTTTDISRAIRAVGYYCGSDKSVSLVYNGSTYYLVGSSNVVSNSMADGAVDLNSAAGGKYIYAYASKDINAGPPVTSIGTGSSPSATFPNAVGLWIGKKSGEDVTLGTVADLNKGAGGDDIFSYQYSSCTTVDSTALRQTMTQVSALLQNYSIYTNSSMIALRSELSLAITCYEELQNYGASTYSQTAINNLNSNLIEKMNALKSTVYLDPNGGTLDGSADELAVELTFGSAQTVDFVVSGYGPAKENHIFLGWATSPTATSGSTTTVNVGLGGHLYAVYAEIYSINYNLNGGIVEDNPDTYTSLTSTITLNNPSKTGYTFAGWTGSNGSTPQMTVTIPVGSMGDKSYTANWTTDQYTITYDLDGGTATNPTSYNVETASFTLNNPTRAGYTFTGWTGSNGTTAQTTVEIPQGSTGDKSYTANWDIINYNIAYNLDGGTVATANPISYNVETANFTLNNPTKTGYTFAGWTGSNGTTAQTSVSIPQGSTGNKSYTANWTINSYTVTFKNYDGSTLYSDNFDYGTMPAYNGETPERAADDNYKYTFSGWDRAIETVTGETSYTAQYTQTAHIYTYESISATEHRKFCETCAHDAGIEAHEFEYRRIDSSTNAYVCAKCGYTEEIEATQYTVTVPSTCQVVQALKPNLSNSYFVATIEAPQRDGNKYFVYWIDGDGNIVSTYYKYSFFVVKSVSLTPVYATQEDYYTERDRGIIVSRVADIRDNGDGQSYSILAEHSVAKSVGTITGHGVLYTTDATQKDLLTVGNDNVENKQAGLSSRTLTGLLEVTIDPGAASTVWARTYVLDSENNPVYGDVKAVSVNSTTASTEEEPIILSTMSFDCTELNELENDTVNEPVEKPTENQTDNIFETLISIWKIIVGIIDRISSIFKGVSI